MKLFHIAGLCVLIVTSGCASIVTGHNQSLSVETRKNGLPIVGANCKLTNDKGTWYVTTPGSAMLQRSYQDLTTVCERAGHAPGSLTVTSTTQGMAFGNILFGGIIGAGVDVATGAAYDYPTLIRVEMGEPIQTLPNPTDQGVTSLHAAILPATQRAVVRGPESAVYTPLEVGQQMGDMRRRELVAAYLERSTCSGTVRMVGSTDKSSEYEATCGNRTLRFRCTDASCHLIMEFMGSR